MPDPNYPDSFPLDSIKKIIDVVKDGSVDGDIAQLAYHAWIVQGYAQKALLGAPNGTNGNGGDGGGDDGFTLLSADDEAAAVQALESLAADDPSAQAAIPWGTILSFVISLIQKILEKQFSGNDNDG